MPSAREQLQPIVLLLFANSFRSALSGRKLLTRKDIEQFFGTQNFDEALSGVASLGVAGIVEMLNASVSQIISREDEEIRCIARAKHQRRCGRASLQGRRMIQK
jgi:hypothetical protein